MNNPQEEIKIEWIVYEKVKKQKNQKKTNWYTRMNDDIQPKIERKADLPEKSVAAPTPNCIPENRRFIQFCTLDSSQIPPKHNKTLQFRPTPI